MLRCGICSASILIYVFGVSSLSVAEQPLLPCHGKSGRGGNNWQLRGLGKLKLTLEPPPAFSSALCQLFSCRGTPYVENKGPFFWNSTLTVHGSNGLTCL